MSSAYQSYQPSLCNFSERDELWHMVGIIVGNPSVSTRGIVQNLPFYLPSLYPEDWSPPPRTESPEDWSPPTQSPATEVLCPKTDL